MCGRYFIDASLACEIDAPSVGDTDAPSVDAHGLSEIREICPGMTVSALIDTGGGPRCAHMRWGFERPEGGLIINARSETAGQKPVFSALFRSQRCVLAASGYFEWRRSDRQKFAIAPVERKLVYLAGLYRFGASGMECVVLTRAPIPALERVHNRMPVLLLERSQAAAWLRGAEDLPSLAEDALSVDAVGDEQLRMPF